MSSRLLDETTITATVPWRAAEAVAGTDSSNASLAWRLDPFEKPTAAARGETSDPHSDKPPPTVDHGECQRRIDALEQELLRHEARLPEFQRAAHQQGFEAGAAEELSKWAGAMTRAALSLAELASVKPLFRAQVEEDAVRLSLAIARKILRREITVDPASIAGLLRVAIEKANAREVLRVRVAPPDAAELSSRLSNFGLPAQVQVHPDPSLERGSLLVDTSQGHVDASVETQLREIERGLADALGRHSVT
jgi:flagellar assembly protein FliH